MNEYKDKEQEKTESDLNEAVEDKADAEQRIVDAKTTQAERAQESADDAREEIKAS